jgi:hypothetical protein
MKKAIHIQVIFWFSIVILNVFVGFYFTYFKLFPSFVGISNVHHFHGLLNLLWLTMLVVQPYLIYKKKWELHRKVGRLSYALMPMLLLSIIMVLRVAYHRDMHILPKQELLSNIALGLPDCIILGTIYVLAIINTHRADRHLRYMLGTSFMMLGPGLGRWITGFSTLSGDDGADLSNNITLSIVALCFANDLYHKKSPVPFSIIFCLILSMKIIFANRYSQAWQAFAEWFSWICF